MFHAGPNTKRDSRRTKYKKRHRNCANPCFAKDRQQKTRRMRKCIRFTMKNMPGIDLSTQLVEFVFRIWIRVRIPYVFCSACFFRFPDGSGLPPSDCNSFNLSRTNGKSHCPGGLEACFTKDRLQRLFSWIASTPVSRRTNDKNNSFE